VGCEPPRGRPPDKLSDGLPPTQSETTRVRMAKNRSELNPLGQLSL
jgi:hypothetical protein